MHGSSPSYLSELAATSLQSIPRLTLHSSSDSHLLKTQQYAVPHIILEPTPPWSQALFSQLGFCLSLKTKLKTFLYSQYIHGPQLKPASTFLTRVCLCACSCMCQCECVHYKCAYVINTESFWW